jgi:quinoprotein dehydrogenase-associated probable ABC transporter substrate-binding protein
MKFATKKIFAALCATTITGINFAAQAADAPKADLVNRKELRVCSDPADLPFSNEKQEGFENKIANIIADDLKVPVSYTWFPKATGFIRMTLFAKKCDLVIGWGQGDDMVLNTNSIYRSTSVLVYKKGSALEGVDTLADPKLQGKKIGVVQNSAGGTLAAKFGLMSNIKGYRMMVDRRFDNPAADMMKDIRSGEIDAGIQWGPIGAYWAAKDGEQLVVVPLLKETTSNKIAFRITMGVRNGDDAWKKQLNEIISRRQGDIDKVMLEYGIPLLVDEDTSSEMVKEPRKSAAATERPPAAAPATKAEAPAAAVPAPAAAPSAAAP